MTPPTRMLREKLAKIDRAARDVTQMALAGDFATGQGFTADTAEILWQRLRALESALTDIQVDMLVHVALSEEEDRLYWQALRLRQAETAPLGAVVQFPQRRAA